MSEAIQIAAGMGGVFLTRSGFLHALVSLSVAAIAAFWLGNVAAVTPALALSLWGTAWVLRHAFAFATCGALAPLLKAWFGHERGFSIYECVLAWLTFVQRLGFVSLLVATSNLPTGPFAAVAVWSGAALLALGVAVSVWATCVIGLDTYYNRDLFMGPRHASIALQGPYSWWVNPVYGVGQLAAYGAALMALSPAGMLAAAVQQLTLYAFNTLVEQPHLRASGRLSMDTELENTLLRSALQLEARHFVAGVAVAGPPPRALPPGKAPRLRHREGAAR